MLYLCEEFESGSKQCCGTGAGIAGNASFRHSGTGSVMRSGSDFGSASDPDLD